MESPKPYEVNHMKNCVTAESMLNDIAKTLTSEKQETTQDIQKPQAVYTPIVEILDGSLFTTSLNVAEVYGKRHADVLRSVEAVKAECPPDFTERNFAPSEYTDPTGRKLPMYRLSRDGLVLLVMGYTGPKAMEHKLGYINAFNAMEAKLKEGVLSIPDFDDPVAAARAWADERERRRLAEQEKALAIEQRNEAVRTKAEIGSRREATAMATASVQKRRADRAEAENAELKDERGKGENFKTVENIPWLNKFFKLTKGAWVAIGMAIKKIAVELGLSTHKVPGQNRDVNAYPMQAIDRFQERVETDPEFLKKYRLSES